MEENWGGGGEGKGADDGEGSGGELGRGRRAGDGCQVVSSPIPGLKLIEHQHKDCEAESITNHSSSALAASVAAQGAQRPSRSHKASLCLVWEVSDSGHSYILLANRS